MAKPKKYLHTYRDIPNFGSTEDRITKGGWLVATSMLNRDSGAIDQSNHRVMEEALIKLDPDQNTWDIMRCGHWAVGWVDHFIVAPGSPAAEYVETSLRYIVEEYPLLDEDDHSTLEAELHDENQCDEHCSLCESEKEDHKRGDCSDDCKLCEEEGEEENDDE